MEDLVCQTDRFGFYPEVRGSHEMFQQTAFPSDVLLPVFFMGIVE